MPEVNAAHPGRMVMSRRVGEEIWIGDPSNPVVILSVVRTGKTKVLIGVNSDRTIAVNRREVAEAILRKREA